MLPPWVLMALCTLTVPEAASADRAVSVTFSLPAPSTALMPLAMVRLPVALTVRFEAPVPATLVIAAGVMLTPATVTSPLFFRVIAPELRVPAVLTSVAYVESSEIVPVVVSAVPNRMLASAMPLDRVMEAFARYTSRVFWLMSMPPALVMVEPVASVP